MFVPLRKILYPLLMVYALFSSRALLAQDPFLAGADLSLLAYFESQGMVYHDHDQPGDALAILKKHGINCIRLRLFTSNAAEAQRDPYNRINNLAYTVPLAVRAKKAGLQFMLDFHYSDTWADPGHQSTPAAWRNLTFPQLVQQMREYNSNCLAAFQDAGAMPDYVQVGNEITPGLLWPSGRVPGTNAAVQWSRLGQLMKAAIQGIHDAAGARMPKIVVHIDRGGDWNTTRWFFDHLNDQGVPYDIIGESYYPFWHGSLESLSNCLDRAAARYHKPVILAETDFPWSASTNLVSLPATPGGQVEYVGKLGRIMNHVPDHLGAGIFWWGTEYQLPRAGQSGMGPRSFFDADGNLLPVADALGRLASPK